MIASRTLNNELTRSLQRLDADYAKTLSVQKKDALLNEAKDYVLENYIARPETNALVRAHLNSLEIKRYALGFTKQENRVVAKFPDNLYRLLRVTATAKAPDCEETRVLQVHLIQSDRITGALRSPNWKPSFEWRETLADGGSDGLHVWHNGEFEITEVLIDYLKKVPDIYTPSLLCETCGPYLSPSGEEIRADRDLQLDSEVLWRKMVRVAELMARRDLGDLEAYQTGMDQIMKLQPLFRET